MSPNDAEALITAVIPTYRRPRLLQRAVASVLAQSIPNIRVEVYDNASADDTGEVISRIQQRDARVGYFRHDRNIGALPNFDFGMRRVTTPFFSLLSDDDVLLPEWYAKALELFGRYPEAVFAASQVAVVDERGRILSVGPRGWDEGLHRPPMAVRQMATLGHPVWTGTVFRREVLDRAGPLDLSLGMATDVEFEMRVAARASFATTSFVGACFQVHERSSVASMTADQMWIAYAELSRAIARLPELRGALHAEVLACLRQNVARSLLRHGVSAVARRDWPEVARTSILLAPIHPRSARALRLASVAGWAGGSYLLGAALYAKRRAPGPVVHRGLQQQYAEWLRALGDAGN